MNFCTQCNNLTTISNSFLCYAYLIFSSSSCTPAGESNIVYRDGFVVEEAILWVRAPMWVQMRYDAFEEQVKPYIIDMPDVGSISTLDISDIDLLNHDVPFKFSEEFMKNLEDNKKNQLQPGIALSDDCTDELLVMGMPQDMADRRRSFAQKLSVLSSMVEVESELLKRMQTADLKFFLRNLQLPLHGTKTVLLQRLVEAQQPGIKDCVAIAQNPASTPADVEAAKLKAAMCRAKSVEALARLYYVRLQVVANGNEAGDDEAPPTSGGTEGGGSAGQQVPRPEDQYNAPAGEAVDADRMEEVLTGVLSVSEESKKKPDLIYIYKDAQTGEKMAEIFVDLLDIDRSEFPLGGNFSVRFTAWRQGAYDVCPYGAHKKDCCKCHRPAVFIGQDEAIFKSFALPKIQWLVPGLEEDTPSKEPNLVRGMRKKGTCLPVTACL